MRRLLPPVCLVALIPVLASAQTVSGVVVDGLDRPLAGVVLQLLDSSSRVSIRALTNERGEFRLDAPAAGRYHLRSTRIGFRPTESEPITLAEGVTVTRRISLTSNPVVLAPIVSVVRPACRTLGLDSTAATFAAWEQIRAALTAADLTFEGRGFNTTTLSYERKQTLDGVTLRQGGVVATGEVTQPWRSVPADSLRKAGYVVMEEDGETRVFHGPDVRVLASGEFAEDHCFRLVSSPDDSTRVGVSFEPTPERGNRPEITGTLWIDRATSELRDMRWQYVNVARNIDETATGGMMEFARLRNGAWVISRWSIRMPLVEIAMRTREISVQFRGLKLVGGELVTAVSPAGDTLFASAPVTLNGLAFDSLTMTPMKAALVGLAGSPRTTLSDSAGRFSFQGLTPGAYRLITQHEALESVGVTSQVTTAVISSSEDLVSVMVPSFETIWRVACQSAPPGRDTALVYGTVRGIGRPEPVAGAAVIATWIDLIPSGRRNITTKRWHLDDHTDSTGSYVLCGVPTQTGLRMRAVSDSGTSGLIDMSPLGGQLVQRRDLLLSHDPDARGIVTGRVIGRNSTPIAGARVIAEGAREIRTDAEGRFTIRDVPLGTQQVEVLAVGLQPVSRVVDVSPADTTRIDIHVTRVVMLQPMNIVASSVRQQFVRDFTDRRLKGLGAFRDSTAIAPHGTLNSVLTQMPGVTMSKNQIFLPMRGVEPGCTPVVWIDGVHVQSTEDLLALRPSDIAALELYTRQFTTPPQFVVRNTRTPQCGAIVAWTKWYWEGSTQSRPPM
ncbi:MAG TPA: carboxypeptidase-like regulatory domain-containing protein [Gemmatimonadaceae bacterium]|nr:carboxypeptidase-like regulatory domain-containing protein [Gemmatimonadaceae bacterium]